MKQVGVFQSGVYVAMTVAASTISWQAAVLTVAAMLISGVLRLLGEWQRRQTFVALMSRAMEGIDVVQNDTPGSQFMKVRTVTVPSRRPSTGS